MASLFPSRSARERTTLRSRTRRHNRFSLAGWLALGALAMGCGAADEAAIGTDAGTGVTADAPQADGHDARAARDAGGSPPAAQGSVSLHLEEPAAGTSSQCTGGPQWVNAPSAPIPVQMQQTSAATIGPRAVDASEGSIVSCSVTRSGTRFAFSADIATPATDGTVELHPTIVHFESDAIDPGAAAQGMVRLVHHTTLKTFIDDQCSFSVNGGSLAVAPGRIWASVTCAALADPTLPTATCLVDQGFLVFENCAE